MMIIQDTELHRMQRTFRHVLDAFARPGSVYLIEAAPESEVRPPSLSSTLESLMKLFVDQAVAFGVVDTEEDTLSDYVISETHSVRVPIGDADFIIIPTRADSDLAYRAISEACEGTLVSPEKGATVFLGCSRVSDNCDGSALHRVEVRGPGVKDVNCFYVDRNDWACAREDRQDEFPCGIEIVLIDGEGHIVAVPRSSKITFGNSNQACQHNTACECLKGVC